MDKLIARLNDVSCRGAVRAKDGTERIFVRHGVINLFALIKNEPEFLRGGMIADKVIGSGAALLLIKAGVAEVYAEVMSERAMSLLLSQGIKTSAGHVVPHIINRAGTGICPVEQLTAHTDSPDEAFMLIEQFMKKQL